MDRNSAFGLTGGDAPTRNPRLPKYRLPLRDPGGGLTSHVAPLLHRHRQVSVGTIRTERVRPSSARGTPNACLLVDRFRTCTLRPQLHRQGEHWGLGTS
jgi:hypothetical protein